MQEKKNTKKNELELLQQESAERLAGWQRAQADLINYKKRQQELMSEWRQFSASDLLSQVLPILDNFSLALTHMPKELEGNEWVKGVMHIKTQLEKFLSNNGIEEIKSLGEKFDPAFHECVSQEESEEKDIVIKELAKGYKLNGKILRPAKVVIGK